MNIDELEEGKYYTYFYDDADWYFRFKSIKNKKSVLSTGYCCYVENGILIGYYYHKNLHLGGSGVNYKEVCLEDLLDYLPIDNPDKINYFRKKKIKMLLNV